MLPRILQVLLQKILLTREFISYYLFSHKENKDIKLFLSNQPTFNLHIGLQKNSKSKIKIKQILVKYYGVYIKTIIYYIGWLLNNIFISSIPLALCLWKTQHCKYQVSIKSAYSLGALRSGR